MSSSARQRPFNDGPSILNQPRVIPGAGPAPHSDSRHGCFAGNTIWQVRYEDGGTTFVNHKGLQRRNWFVEKITRNVLDRLSGPRPTAPCARPSGQPVDDVMGV